MRFSPFVLAIALLGAIDAPLGSGGDRCASAQTQSLAARRHAGRRAIRGACCGQHETPPSPSSVAAAASRDIEQLLRVQVDAWNRGDIDAFMEHYWKSDELSFSSGGKTTRGWQATKDNYRRRYPTREAMGRVQFSELEITPLGDNAALVLGRWRLERDAPVGGNFSLILRKLDGRWLIVHDHTSRE
jgi:ketosteroid isomerase-like protein